MRYCLYLLVLVWAGSCNKDDGGSNTPDNLSVITLTTPTAGFIYLNGGTLRVEGNIVDYDKISTARLQVKNKTTGAVLYEQTASAGNITTYFFLWNWTISGISASTQATVTVTARDFRNFEISKAVDVTLAP